MADPWVGEFSFLGNSPGINEELRRRIALQMLSSGKGRGFPKNIGEGLSAIGDAIGDRGITNRLAAEEAASEKAGAAAVGRLSGPQAYAPPDDVPAEPAAAPAPATPPVPLFTAPEQPASMLRPELPTGLGGASAGGVGPESMYTSPNRLGMPPAAAQAPPDRWAQQSAALSGIETGGANDPYAMLHAVTKSGDRAYGKYGIMGANIPAWTRDALGRSLTPQQFLADRDAQEATAKHRFQGYANKYGEEGAARAWFGGEGGMKNLGATDLHGRLNVGTYGQDFMRRMGGPQAAASPRDAVTAQLVAQGQDPVEPQQQATLGSPILPQGMNAAPPQQPIRAMPQQPVRVTQAGPPEAGYVPTLGPAPTPPPTTTPTLQRIQQEIAQSPPAVREGVRRAFEPYIKDELAKLGQQGVIYQDQLKRHHEREKLIEEAKISAPKRVLEAQELQQKIQAGPHTTVDGRLMVPDPNKPPGSQWIDVTAPVPGSTSGGPPQIKTTKEQADALKFLNQMYVTTEQLRGKEKLLAEGWRDEIAGRVPFAGNALLSRNYRLAKRAAEFWVAANLRDISGAVIGKPEHADQMKWLMPQYGDDVATLRDKEARRNSVMSGMYNGLGTARPLADYGKKEIIDMHTSTQAKVNEAMSHLKDKPIGYISENKKTGEKRIWDGKNWLDY